MLNSIVVMICPAAIVVAFGAIVVMSGMGVCHLGLCMPQAGCLSSDQEFYFISLKISSHLINKAIDEQDLLDILCLHLPCGFLFFD